MFGKRFLFSSIECKMAFSLVLNSTNVVGQGNSSYVYRFQNGSFSAKNLEMCVSAATIPYAWFNVTQQYNNRLIQMDFPSGVGTVSLSLTLPDGFYSIADINAAIQQQMITQGLYLLNSAGQYVFYFQMLENVTYYAIQFLSFPVPNALPVGYSFATSGTYSNLAGLPTVDRVPVMTIAAGGIGVQTGFSNGNYPASTAFSTTQSSLSDLTPNGTTVNSLVLRCNLIRNMVTVPSDILDSFPINATFGSNITYDPAFEKWLPVSDGTFGSMIVNLVDQNFNQIFSEDPNVSLTLLIRERR